MTEQERTQLVNNLKKEANSQEASAVGVNTFMVYLLRQAAARVRADGLRLKAQSQMAVTLNAMMEQALAAVGARRKIVDDPHDLSDEARARRAKGQGSRVGDTDYG